jgi:hypothetical protein
MTHISENIFATSHPQDLRGKTGFKLPHTPGNHVQIFESLNFKREKRSFKISPHCSFLEDINSI